MGKKMLCELAADLKRMRPHGANAYAGCKDKNIATGRMVQWQEMVMGLASYCAGQNPRFKRDTFLAACGLEG